MAKQESKLQKATRLFFSKVPYKYYRKQTLYTKWFPIKDAKSIPELESLPELEVKGTWVRKKYVLKNIIITDDV